MWYLQACREWSAQTRLRARSQKDSQAHHYHILWALSQSFRHCTRLSVCHVNALSGLRLVRMLLPPRVLSAAVGAKSTPPVELLGSLKGLLVNLPLFFSWFVLFVCQEIIYFFHFSECRFWLKPEKLISLEKVGKKRIWLVRVTLKTYRFNMKCSLVDANAAFFLLPE